MPEKAEPDDGIPEISRRARFAEAVTDARQAAAETPAGRVPEAWLADYLTADAESPETVDFVGWLAARTRSSVEHLTEAVAERFARLRQPIAAFTTPQTDETVLGETPLGNDESLTMAIFKRGGRLLLRLQSRNAAFQNEIAAMLLAGASEPGQEPRLLFVAMAATGVGDWSVGWAQITESERDAILAKTPIELRKVRLGNHHVRLLPLLSLAAAEDARAGSDPLARSVWMEWMERWRREMQDAAAA